jgi:hypothetical protein
MNYKNIIAYDSNRNPVQLKKLPLKRGCELSDIFHAVSAVKDGYELKKNLECVLDYDFILREENLKYILLSCTIIGGSKIYLKIKSKPPCHRFYSESIIESKTNLVT